MDSHILPKFGETDLRDLTRFELHSHLNQLAKKYSESVVRKARTWLKAAIEEATDQDFLLKNPAKKFGNASYAQELQALPQCRRNSQVAYGAGWP
jgi:hypothetical protein